MATYVETLVDERLRPTEHVALPPTSTPKQMNPRFLIRTTSLDRIRQFPTYFCRQSSSEIYQWISSSRKTLSKVISDLSQQLHHILLTASVYTVVGVLVVQLISCFITIVTNCLPHGFIFLLLCIFAIIILANKIMQYKPKEFTHTSRARTKRLKED